MIGKKHKAWQHDSWELEGPTREKDAAVSACTALPMISSQQKGIWARVSVLHNSVLSGGIQVLEGQETGQLYELVGILQGTQLSLVSRLDDILKKLR